jgi:hypothetical protein
MIGRSNAAGGPIASAACGDERACVRTLEARFHPASKAVQGFVVVGRVRCSDRDTQIEPAPIPAQAVKPFDASRLHQKLEFIVMSAVGDPVRELLSLRSGFWSFVEVEPSGEGRR